MIIELILERSAEGILAEQAVGRALRRSRRPASTDSHFLAFPPEP